MIAVDQVEGAVVSGFRVSDLGFLVQYKMGGFLAALNPKPGMWPRLHKGTKARDGFWGLGLRDVKGVGLFDGGVSQKHGSLLTGRSNKEPELDALTAGHAGPGA